MWKPKNKYEGIRLRGAITEDDVADFLRAPQPVRLQAMTYLRVAVSRQSEDLYGALISQFASLVLASIAIFVAYTTLLSSGSATFTLSSGDVTYIVIAFLLLLSPLIGYIVRLRSAKDRSLRAARLAAYTDAEARRSEWLTDYVARNPPTV